MNLEVSLAEEALEHAYWRWRNTLDTEGYDIRKESEQFLQALRTYQEALNKSGHEWPLKA